MDVTAHKLIEGHKMGIHNDYIGEQETHRLVVQVNPFWTAEHGGYLMLFEANNPEKVSKLVQPLNNTAIGFEISKASYHAVSMVSKSPRYTVVYTFNRG